MRPTLFTLSTCAFKLPEQYDYLPRAASLRGGRPRSSAIKRADGLLYASEEQAHFAGSLDILELSSGLSACYEHECRHGA